MFFYTQDVAEAAGDVDILSSNVIKKSAKLALEGREKDARRLNVKHAMYLSSWSNKMDERQRGQFQQSVSVMGQVNRSALQSEVLHRNEGESFAVMAAAPAVSHCFGSVPFQPAQKGAKKTLSRNNDEIYSSLRSYSRHR